MYIYILLVPFLQRTLLHMAKLVDLHLACRHKKEYKLKMLRSSAEEGRRDGKGSV